MLIDAQESQLVLVDYQSRLMPAIHGPQVLANALRLAQAARLLSLPVFATEQNPSGSAKTRLSCAACARRCWPRCISAPARKVCPSCCARRPSRCRAMRAACQAPAEARPGRARAQQRRAGCEAHVCLLQTALDLIEDEFDVWVVTDACGSRTERNRDAAFDRLAGAGAELVTTEMVVFEWLRSAEHPQFKALHALIK
jgi:nicotinamidase-related amidase